MKTILGLDLGTTSIGWALVREGENADIIKTKRDKQDVYEESFSTQWQEQAEVAEITGNYTNQTPKQDSFDDPPIVRQPPETPNAKWELLFSAFDAVSLLHIFIPIYLAKQKYGFFVARE